MECMAFPTAVVTVYICVCIYAPVDQEPVAQLSLLVAVGSVCTQSGSVTAGMTALTEQMNRTVPTPLIPLSVRAHLSMSYHLIVIVCL